MYNLPFYNVPILSLSTIQLFPVLMQLWFRHFRTIVVFLSVVTSYPLVSNCLAQRSSPWHKFTFTLHHVIAFKLCGISNSFRVLFNLTFFMEILSIRNSYNNRNNPYIHLYIYARFRDRKKKWEYLNGLFFFTFFTFLTLSLFVINHNYWQ